MYVFRFNKIKRFIRIYHGTRYLTQLGSEKYEAICNRIRCVISLKSGITYPTSHFSKINVNSYKFLPIEKILSLHNAIIHIKSVLNKDKNYYCLKIFLEKFSYQLA